MYILIYVTTLPPPLALEPKWRCGQLAQGLRYRRVKALPNRPYVTHNNMYVYIYLYIYIYIHIYIYMHNDKLVSPITISSSSSIIIVVIAIITTMIIISSSSSSNQLYNIMSRHGGDMYIER